MLLTRTLTLSAVCLLFPLALASLEGTECTVPVATEASFDLEAFLADSYAAKKCRERSDCCKICDKGKACGDTCIRREYNCSKGQGCACNKEDLCDDVAEGTVTLAGGLAQSPSEGEESDATGESTDSDGAESQVTKTAPRS